MQLNVAYDFLPKKPSSHASLVMDHFGIGFETGQHVIAEELELPIAAGDVVLFTGSSGSGKTSLMRAVSKQLTRTSRACQEASDSDPRNPGDPRNLEDSGDLGSILDIDSLELGTNILVDSFDLPLEESMPLLSTCGLGEAQLLLRTPAELSDGQRYRFRLAMALSKTPHWILADEFTATLDRTLAKVVAFNIRRHASRTGTGFLLATTHEDVLEDLQPNLHVRSSLDGEIVYDRLEVKKKVSALHGKCKSPMRPKRTGRTSLGGIIEATTLGSPGT